MLIIRPEEHGGQDFGSDADHNPPWLDAALRYNKDHLYRHNHKLAITDIPPIGWEPYQMTWCEKNKGAKGTPEYLSCLGRFNRDNNTWKKLDVILKHLLNNDAEHILFIDVDSLIVHPNIDTLLEMVQELEKAGKDMMLATENWRPSGDQLINTGVILARNTDWSRHFLSEIIALRRNETCTSNEQLCLNGLYRSNRLGAKDHMLIASGLVWNRHPKPRIGDAAGAGAFAAEARITHFMGGAKAGLPNVDSWTCGHCPCALGRCSGGGGPRGACLDLATCAAGNRNGRATYAFAMVDDLRSATRSFTAVGLRSVVKAAARHGADALLIVPEDGVSAHPLTADERTVLQKHKIGVKSTAWNPQEGGPGEQWLVLQVLGLPGYDAVVYVDNAVSVAADFALPLKCAARGRFIASAGYQFPLDSKVFAVRPSPALFKAAASFLATAARSAETGWGGAGWAPTTAAPLRALDGMLWTLLYANGGLEMSSAAARAFNSSGAPAIPAYQVDPSVWRGTQADGTALYRDLNPVGCDGTVTLQTITSV